MMLFRKIVLGSLIGVLFVGQNLSTLNLPVFDVLPPVYASSVLYPFAEQILTVAPNETKAQFISPAFSVESFYAAQLAWQTTSTSGIQFFLRQNDTAPWIPFEQDVDAISTVSEPLLVEFSTSVQILAQLQVTNGIAPVVSKIELSLLDPGKTMNGSLQVNADETVITRKNWGADESLRLRSTRDRLRTEQAKKVQLAKPPKTTSPTVFPTAAPKADSTKPTEASEYGPNCSTLESKYPQEFKVANVIRTNSSDAEYTWPIAYTTKLRKLVVHHTDMDIKDYDQNGTIDAADYQAAVRSIYYFHTISRDWGDIGYNYLIDPAGHIYEGRAGGDMAISAHTLCKNNGSLGIAVLGTFQDQYPTQAALVALQSLVSAKGKEYHIDLTGKDMFYGSLLPNLIGHRDARATSCPGEKLYNLLPALRLGNLTDTTKIIYPEMTQPILNYEATSVSSPVTPVAIIAETKKVYKAAPVLISQAVPAVPGEVVTLNVQFRNQGNTIWNADTMIRPTYLPTGITLLKQVKQSEELVAPEGLATFLPQFLIDKSLAKTRQNIDFYVVPNGTVDLSSFISKVEIVVAEKPLNEDISLNGISPASSLQSLVSKNLVAAQLKLSTDTLSHFLVQDIGGELLEEAEVPLSLLKIRVKLSMPEVHSEATVNDDYKLFVDGVLQYTGDNSQKVIVVPETQGLIAKAGANLYHGKVIRLVPQTEAGIITLVNFQHQPEWSKNLNDNQYRGVMEWRTLNSQLTTINELSLQNYLKGLAEVSNSAPLEKQRVMAIIARSYAGYYLTKDRKFPGMPYDLDDDPNVSQKYLGYGYEKRSPAFSQAVENTQGKVVTFQGELVKTPYFSKSDGTTRSAKEVWGWDNTPYLISVPDPLCKNTDGKIYGHGVGLSGCGAEEAARRGYTAEHILSYYYPGTTIESM